MTWLIAFVSGAPVWVWPLLALLIWLGLRARRDRETSVAGYYALPAFALLSLNSVAGSPCPGLSWPVFAFAYLAGAVGGDFVQGDLIRWRRGGRIAVRGEWVTLAAMMGVYWLNFAQGYVSAQHPDLAASAMFVAVSAAASGFLSGQFAGRALRVIRTPSADIGVEDRG